jgi:hypothetical protein
MVSSIALLGLYATASTATLLWDGRLNQYNDASYLADWTWANPIGPYQYYIHGSRPASDYVVLGEEFKNAADRSSKRGLRISIDDTSSWNGQTMMRTELIPSSSTASLNTSRRFYHFSIAASATDPPTQNEEHQITFFESHFTELKYGSNSPDQTKNLLRWHADGQARWNVTLEPGVWHNVAYGIDFGAGTVSFYHSVGGDALKLAAGPVKATTVSDGKDFHVGVLRLPGTAGPSRKRESWMFSGVYIEDSLTTVIG